MSKRHVVGVLSALFVVAAILFYEHYRSQEAPRSDARKGTDVPVTSPSPTSSPANNISAPHASQTEHASISGTVRIHGSPTSPSDSDVSAHRSDTERISTTRTDRNGSYTLQITSILPDSERIRIQVAASSPSLSMLKPIEVILRPGEHLTGVDITLYPVRLLSISGRVTGHRAVYVKPETVTSQTTPRDFVETEETPWPGARISVTGNAITPLETVSDPQGFYRFPSLSLGEYIVTAHRPAGAAVIPVPVPSDVIVGSSSGTSDLHAAVTLFDKSMESVDFDFQRDSIAIEGRVTDTLGNPLSGAQVIAADFTKADPGGHSEKTYFPNATVTDEKGYYTLIDLPSPSILSPAIYLLTGEEHSYLEVRAATTGFVPSTRRVLPFTEDIVFSGMRIVEDVVSVGLAQSQAKADETLKLDDLQLPESHGDVITGVDIVLKRAAVVSGKVRDASSRVVAGPRAIRMDLTKPTTSDADTKDRLQPTYWRPLGNNGQFTFSDLSPGHYIFKVSNEQGDSAQTARNDPIAVNSGDVIQGLEVIVESPAERGNIAGLILDARSNEPIDIPGPQISRVTGMSVFDAVKVLRVVSASEPSPAFGEGSVNKSQKGTFLFEGISAGTATLAIALPGYQRRECDVPVKAGATSYRRFLVEPSASIAGRVTDRQTNAPIEEFDVEILGIEPDAGGRHAVGDVVVSKLDEGAFAIRDLPSGTVRLEVKAPGYVSNTAEARLVSGMTTELVVRLHTGSRLYGYVTVSGEPKAMDLVLRSDDKGRDAQVARTRSDAKGYYEFHDLRGDYSLEASLIFQVRPRATRRVHKDITVGGEDERCDITVEENAGIQGTFRCPDSNRDTGIQVRVSEPRSADGQEGRVCVEFWESMKDSWEYDARTLEPGTYIVTAYCKRLRVNEPSVQESRTVTLSSGEIKTVDFVFEQGEDQESREDGLAGDGSGYEESDK